MLPRWRTPCRVRHREGAETRKPRAKYFCPMCPGVESDKPGTCPKCGMALEAKNVPAGGEENDSELRDMTRRFCIGGALTLPVFLVGMVRR